MAYDKVVDSTQLDNNLTSVADAIRSKGGTSSALTFPAGFVSAINAISTGSSTPATSDFTQMKTGTYTAPSSDTLLSNSMKFECGFRPRVFAMFVQNSVHYDNNLVYKLVCSFMVADENGNNIYAGSNFAYKQNAQSQSCLSGYSENTINTLHTYSTGVQFGNASNVYMRADATYKWFALR